MRTVVKPLEGNMKQCTKCGIYAKKDWFSVNNKRPDKLACWCKTCTRSESKGGYNKNRIKRGIQVKAYQKTLKGKSVAKKSVKLWLEKNPKKYIAHKVVRMAIDAKILTLGSCEVCGSNELIHAHHNDYNLPFEVKWLCPQHHKDEHDRLSTIEEERNG